MPRARQAIVCTSAGLPPKEALLVGVEDRDERDLGEIEAR
jgi:hypothetical protein